MTSSKRVKPLLIITMPNDAKITDVTIHDAPLSFLLPPSLGLQRVAVKFCIIAGTSMLTMRRSIILRDDKKPSTSLKIQRIYISRSSSQCSWFFRNWSPSGSFMHKQMATAHDLHSRNAIAYRTYLWQHRDRLKSARQGPLHVPKHSRGERT